MRVKKLPVANPQSRCSQPCGLGSVDYNESHDALSCLKTPRRTQQLAPRLDGTATPAMIPGMFHPARAWIKGKGVCKMPKAFLDPPMETQHRPMIDPNSRQAPNPISKLEIDVAKERGGTVLLQVLQLRVSTGGLFCRLEPLGR